MGLTKLTFKSLIRKVKRTITHRIKITHQFINPHNIGPIINIHQTNKEIKLYLLLDIFDVKVFNFNATRYHL